MRSMRDIFRSYAQFDAQGRHTNGTDKQSNHNYGDAYESLFVELEDIDVTKIPSQPHIEVKGQYRSTRDKVELVMEVGVADGACLRAWRDIFPNATIVGMDIHHSDQAHGDRIEFHIGDQRDRDHCRKAAAGRQFDLIVEDAVHQLDNTMLTLFWLWPFVKPGGLYVVEEWYGIDGCQGEIKALWPNAQIIGTCGPHIADEPLVAFRKPL